MSRIDEVVFVKMKVGERRSNWKTTYYSTSGKTEGKASEREGEKKKITILQGGEEKACNKISHRLKKGKGNRDWHEKKKDGKREAKLLGRLNRKKGERKTLGAGNRRTRTRTRQGRRYSVMTVSGVKGYAERKNM